MAETNRDDLEAIMDEMLLEDPDLSHGTLARWCERFPEHRDELARFAATLAKQKALPEGPQIDEESVARRLMNHASTIMRRQDEAMSEERLILYTSAPADYDGFSTVELVADAGRDNRGKVLRKVSMEPRDKQWQTGRYLSGLHGFVTPEEAAKYPTVWHITV